jgi:hypothetical protein
MPKPTLTYDKRFAIVIETSLYDHLKNVAKAEDRSVSAYLRHLVRENKTRRESEREI